jgi:TRAP-type C4-dicarboxylate transport system substrate-binding protein
MKAAKHALATNLLLGATLLLGPASRVAAEPAPAKAAQVRVKLATLAPRGTSLHQSLLSMREKWRQAPEGGVDLVIYTDGTMGSEADMVRRMRLNQLQAAMLSVGGLTEIEPEASALQHMPMMFRSFEEVDYVREKLRPMLEKKMLDKGFVVLFWGDAGWIRYFSRTAALHPDEFKKMKMFVSAGDNKQVDIMRSAGYRPVQLEWSDALTGLQTEMVDALATIPLHALAGQFYTVAPHMVHVNYAPLVGATVITKKAWDALPAATQEAMLRAAAESGSQICAASRRESEEAVEAMRKRGLTVHTLTPQLETEWRRVMEEVFYPRIRGKMVPADIFDEVRRLLAEFRAAGARSGR